MAALANACQCLNAVPNPYSYIFLHRWQYYQWPASLWILYRSMKYFPNPRDLLLCKYVCTPSVVRFSLETKIARRNARRYAQWTWVLRRRSKLADEGMSHEISYTAQWNNIALRCLIPNHDVHEPHKLLTPRCLTRLLTFVCPPIVVGLARIHENEFWRTMSGPSIVRILIYWIIE